jgi:hypothetical protein
LFLNAFSLSSFSRFSSSSLDLANTFEVNCELVG